MKEKYDSNFRLLSSIDTYVIGFVKKYNILNYLSEMWSFIIVVYFDAATTWSSLM